MREFYTGNYGERVLRFDELSYPNELLDRAKELDLVWLVSSSALEAALDVPVHLGRFRREGWFHCRSSREAGVTLELLLAPLPATVLDQPRLQFEGAATLFAPAELQISDDLLRLRAGLHSDDKTFLDRHSLAIHVIDSRSDERVAQGDTGVGPGTYVPLCREIDISALPPGEYEVRVALYDWQTGERLSAHDLETDEVSDIHRQ